MRAAVVARAALRRVLLASWIYVFPLVAPWAILYAVNAGDPARVIARSHLPAERSRPDRCTWACHNQGCAHRPVLPAFLTGDQGLFGLTVRSLYRAGGLLSGDRAAGYGAANLVLLCVAWPLFMYVLWVKAWRQALEIRRLRKGDPA